MKRTARLASLALVGALAFTACGGNDDDGGADAAPRAGETVDVEQLLDDMAEGMEEMTTAHMTMEIDAGGQKLGGEGDISYAGEATEARFVTTVPGVGETTMIVVGTTLYMNMGKLTRGKFLKTDLDDPHGPLGDMSAMLRGLDPVEQFETFRDGYTEAVYEGEEEVQGETMRHYTVTLDLREVEEFQGLATEGELEQIPMEIWLDAENRMRRMRMEMEPQGQKISTVIEVSDLGKDVDIQAPPASEIFEGRAVG